MQVEPLPATLSRRSRFSKAAGQPSLRSTRFASVKLSLAGSRNRPNAGAGDRRLQGDLHGRELIATLAKSSSGRILFDGVDITKNPGAMRQRLGITPRSAPLIALVEWCDGGGTRCLMQSVLRSTRAACRALRLDRRTLVRPI